MSSANFQACKRSLALSSQSSSSSSIQFCSRFIPINMGGRIYPSSNLSNSHSPSCSIHGVLFLQTNTLALLLHLHLPRLLWSSSHPLASHFKLQRFSQNVPIIPLQHMPVPNISLHSPLPSEPLFPSILTSPSGPLFSFSPSALHHKLLSPLLSRFFLKMPSHFPSNTMSHSYIRSQILHNYNKPFLSASARTFLRNGLTELCT